MPIDSPVGLIYQFHFYTYKNHNIRVAILVISQPVTYSHFFAYENGNIGIVVLIADVLRVDILEIDVLVAAMLAANIPEIGE